MWENSVPVTQITTNVNRVPPFVVVNLIGT